MSEEAIYRQAGLPVQSRERPVPAEDGGKPPLKLVDTEWATPPVAPEDHERKRRARLLKHPQTEFGLLYRVLDLYGDRLRYLKDEEAFLVWNDSYWARDDGAAMNLVRRALERCAKEARGHSSRKWLMQQQQASKVVNILKLARSFDEPSGEYPTIPVGLSALDRDSGLLNTQNGIVDLATGGLHLHAPGRLMTRITDAAYLPGADLTAECPTWLEFVGFGCHGDVEAIAYLQRCFGYTLTGSQAEKCFFVVLGEPDTGKSTLLETARRVIGDYAAATAMDTFIEKRAGASQTRSDLVRLGGRRFVTASEMPENAVLDHALLKSLTGGDGTAIREVYEKAQESLAGYKIWMGTNYPPRFRQSDEGLANRVRVIAWDRLAPSLDKQLRDKLLRERDGILTWMIRGAIDYHQRGALDTPKEYKDAAQAYVRSQSPLLAFAEECLDRDPAAPPIRVLRLFQAYVRWCEVQGHPRMTLNMFSRRLTSELRIDERRSREGMTRVGVRLREQIRMALDAESAPHEDG